MSCCSRPASTRASSLLLLRLSITSVYVALLSSSSPPPETIDHTNIMERRCGNWKRKINEVVIQHETGTTQTIIYIPNSQRTIQTPPPMPQAAPKPCPAKLTQHPFCSDPRRRPLGQQFPRRPPPLRLPHPRHPHRHCDPQGPPRRRHRLHQEVLEGRRRGRQVVRQLVGAEQGEEQEEAGIERL